MAFLKKLQKKSVIILDAGSGQLGNQLWSFASVYAYCLAKNFECRNYFFFPYQKYFRLVSGSRLIRLIFFSSFYRGRNFFRRLYPKYVQFIKNNRSSRVIIDEDIFYLAPTQESSGRLLSLEKDDGPIYLIGRLFRNLVGLLKYHQEIVDYFKPQLEIAKRVETIIWPLQKKYKHLVGVHIRQGDYKQYDGGQHYFSSAEVLIILKEYLNVSNQKLSETVFVICSDGQINPEDFANLNVVISRENEGVDLFLLASCAVIIGANSSFGAFASYLGNIPLIVFQRGSMDWNYYLDKKEFFPNKYNTVVHF